MQKIIINAAAALIATTGTALANYNGVTSPDNFYVGVGILRDVSKLSRINPRSGTRTNFGTNGTAGELFLGYGVTWDNFYYTGLEIFGQISSNRGQIAGFNIKQESNYGVRFMPGIKLSQSSTLYGDIGYIRTRFVFNGASRFGRSRARNANGLQLGLGIQTLLTRDISLRGGWSINQFQNLPGNRKLLNNQFYLDAIYHFWI